MTDQEAFDVMARHLLTQRAKSEDDILCRYRGPGGRKCAVGALILDEEYSPAMEGVSAADLSAADLRGQYKCTALKGLSISMLTNAQIIHDHYEPGKWAIELRKLALEYNLSDAVVDEFRSW
jgi:hypothetical protein